MLIILATQYTYKYDFILGKAKNSQQCIKYFCPMTNPVEEFHFPMELQRYRVIKNIQHFNQLIKKETTPLKRDDGFQSTFITNSDGSQTLRIQCKQCQAYFKYINSKKGQNFVLKECNQHHKHALKQVHYFNQSIIDRIEKYLQQDERQEKHQLCADICVNYRITPKQFEQLYSQAVQRMKRLTLLYDGKQIEEMIKKLKNERYTIIGDYINSKMDRQVRKITKSVVILNDQMIINYQKYGECCYIPLDDRYQLNKWFVGAFLGVGRKMQIIPFGLFLLKAIDADHIKGLFKIFFSTVTIKPASIITQDAFYFDKAILQLKAEEFMNSEHIIDYTTFADRFYRKNIIFRKVIGDLLRQPQKRKFFEKLDDLYKGDGFAEMDIDLQDLVSRSEKVCLSQIPPVPIGPYRVVRNKSQKKMDFSFFKQFYKMLYVHECYVGKHLYSKIKNLLTMLLDSDNDSQQTEEKPLLNVIPELKFLQNKITSNVMDYLISKSFITLHLRTKQISENIFRVYEGHHHYVEVVRRENKWNCQCQQSIKTMLPCAHELVVCIKGEYPLNIQVGRRWTNEDQKMEEFMKRQKYRKPRNKKVTISQFLA